MPTLLLATTNPGKKEEMASLLAGKGVDLKSLADFPDLGEVEEDGETFMKNAEIKALAYARATGLWTLADDSGLEVEALGGAPGVHSARFAGPGKDDRANMAKLLLLLEGESNRRARFQTAMVLADPQGVKARTTGMLQGQLLGEAKGEGGFGYDPIFQPQGETRTLAQMAAHEKNAISHRFLALQDMEKVLLDLVWEEPACE